MHKIFIILVSIALTGVLVSQGISEETNLKNEGWKSCKLMLVSKGKPVKVRTTAQIMDSGKHNKTPTRFKTYLISKLPGGTPIILIDENQNGQYDDVGTDITVFGKSSYGIPLSNIISIKKKLYHFKMDTENNKAWLKPYEGPTGKIDLISKFKGLVKPDLIILQSADGNYYFDVAKKKSFTLPCSSYSLWLAYIDNGKGLHIAINGSKMDPIEIKEKEEGQMGNTPTIKVKWGPPFTMDFNFSIKEKTTRSRNKKTAKVLTAFIPYNSVKVFGSSNEEYFNFAPELTLHVDVKDARQKTVSRGSFPVRC